VTLVWTDPPAAAGSAVDSVLVNDLDLTVQKAYVNTYIEVNTGNTVSKLTYDYFLGNNDTTADTANTAEKVILATHPAVNMTVMVASTRLSRGPQRYSLVITGQLRPKYWAWQGARLQVLALIYVNGAYRYCACWRWRNAVSEIRSWNLRGGGRALSCRGRQILGSRALPLLGVQA